MPEKSSWLKKIAARILKPRRRAPAFARPWDALAEQLEVRTLETRRVLNAAPVAPPVAEAAPADTASSSPIAPNSQLSIGGQAVDSVVYQFASSQSGQIVVTTGGHVQTIQFANATTIQDTYVAESREFEFLVTPTALTLSDDSVANDGRSQLSAANGTSIIFFAPTNSLAIHAAHVGGTNVEHSQLEIAGVDAQFRAGLSLMADSIQVTGAVQTQQQVVELFATQSLIISSTASIENSAGQVKLDAGADGMSIVAGRIDVSNATAGGVGGDVFVLGKQVGLIESASIDASGASGGGRILIGGDYHGENPLIRNATATFVGRDATLSASAMQAGNGGTIIVWANELTRFYGTLAARGGASGGDGGFAEISSPQSLVTNGSYDLDAPVGQAGTLLFDPLDIVIMGSGIPTIPMDGSDTPDVSTTGLTQSALGQVLFADVGTADPFVIRESEIEGTAANIVLEARRNISVSGTFTTSLLLLTNRSLTLRTENNVGNAGGINLTGSTTGAALLFRTQGTGTITITASTSGVEVGNITLGGLQTAAQSVSVTTNKGSIAFNGTVTTANGTLTASAADAVTVAAAVSTGTGAISLNANTDGSGSQGFANTSTITTTNNTAAALAINVNSAAGGTGGVALGANMTVGTGAAAKLSISTAAGGNASGGSITRTAGTLSAAAGTVELNTPTAGASGIGTNAANILATAGTVVANAGAGGVFVTESNGASFRATATGAGEVRLTTTAGALTISGATTTDSGAIVLDADDALTINANVSSTAGTIQLNTNTDGAGAEAFTQASGVSISTGSASVTAVQVLVNTATGGTGTAAVRDISTGDGGTITVRTNTGGNVTGGSITQPSGTLNVGSGTVTLATGGTAAAIGVVATPVQTNAATITASSGSGGVFITEANGANFSASATSTGDVSLRSTTGTLTIGAATGTGSGDVTLSADDLAVNAAVTTTGIVTLQPVTNGAAIDLGTNTVGQLGLTDGELDLISAGTLRIGSATTGAMTISSSIDFTDAPVISTLRLTTGSTVSGVAGGVKVASLAVVADGNVTLTNSDTNVTNVAIDTSADVVQFVNASGFSVTTVDSIIGIDGSSVDLTATTGDVTVINTADANDIDATGNIAISLLGADAKLTINTTADVESTGGNIVVTADRQTLNGTVTASAGTNQTVTLQAALAGRLINLGSTSDATANSLEIGSAEVNRVTTDVLRIGQASAGNLTISAAIAPTGASTLQLRTGGTVSQTASLVVTNLAISSSGNVTLTNAANDVTTFAATTDTGSISLHDTSDFATGTVDGVTGVTAGGAGDVTLTADGIVTVTAAITATDNNVAITGDGGVTGTGTITAGTASFTATNANADVTLSGLAVTGGIALNTTGVSGNATITNSGATTLATSNVGGDLIVTATGGTLTDSGIVNVNGDATFATRDSAGQAMTLDQLSITGAVTARTLNSAGTTVVGGGITLANNKTLAVLLVASTGNVSLTATGDITDSAATDVVDVLANQLTLSATGKIGDVSAEKDLDITVTSLAANSSATGDIVIDETDALTIGGAGLATTNGAITVTAGGAISIAATVNARSNGNATLTATTGNLDIAADLLSTAAASGTAGDGSGTLTLAASAGSITRSAVGTLKATVGDIVLTAGAAAGAIGSSSSAVLTQAATINATAGSGGVFITEADGATFTASATGLGEIQLASTTGNAALNTITADTTNGLVTITAGGAITEVLASESANITANRLALSATNGIGVADDIDLAVSNVEAVTSTGGIALQNSGLALTIGGVSGGLGGLDVTGASGFISVTNNATISVAEGISTTAGNITLTATGTTSDMTINANSGVVSSSGNVLLSADRTATISEDVTTGGSGTLTVTGNAAAGARNIVVNSAAVVSVVGGHLLLDADRGTNVTGSFVGLLISDATVKSTGAGTLTLLGRGGTSTTDGNAGVVITGATALIQAPSDVTITGTAVDTTGAAHHGVLIDSGATVTLTGAANLTLTGSTSSNPAVGMAVNLGATSAVTLTLEGATHTIIADSMHIGSSSSIAAGLNQLTIRPETAATTTIQLGAADATSVLALTNAELNTITAGTLVIGNAASGSITVASDVTFAPLRVTTLCLNTATTVTATAGGIVVSDLAISSGGAVTFTDTTTDVNSLAITTTNDAVRFDDADGFAVGLVCGVAGINGAAITLNAGSGGATAADNSVTIADAGIAADVSGTGAITVTLAGDDAKLTIAANASVTTTSGGVTLEMDKLDLLGDVTASGQTVSLRPREANEAIQLGSTTDAAADTLEISDAELDRITAASLVIGATTAGQISITDAITRAAATDVTLTTGGNNSVTFSGATALLNVAGGNVIIGLNAAGGGGVVSGGATTDISANNLTITAGTGGIGSAGNVLATAVTRLEATAKGGVYVTDADNLTIGGIGVMVGVSTTAGALELTANGSLTTSELIANTGGGNLRLSAVGNTTSADLAINEDVTASGGNGSIELTAGDNITQTVGVVTAAGAGTVTYSAGDPLTGTSAGTITLTTGITASTGVVTLRAADGVILNAATSDVTTSTAGTVVRFIVNADTDADGTGSYSQTVSGATVNTSGLQITATDIDLGTGTATLDANLGDATFFTSTATATIGVGSIATFWLTDSELDRVTSTGTIRIGQASHAAGISIAVTEALTQSAKNFSFITGGGIVVGGNNFTTTGDVSLSSGADITTGVGQWVVGGLSATAQTGIELNGNVTRFSATNATDGNITFVETNGVVLGTVANNAGSSSITITTAAGDITVGEVCAGDSMAGGTVTLISASDIFDDVNDSVADVVANAVTLTAASGIGLSTGGSLDVEVHSVTSASTDTGGIAINLLNGGDATRNLLVDHSTTVTSAAATTSGSITFTGTAGSGQRTFAAVDAISGDVSISAAAGKLSLGTIQSDSGVNSTHDITVTASNGSIEITGSLTSDSAATLSASGSIDDAATDPFADVIAATISLTAGTGIGNVAANDTLDLNTTTLTTATTGTGGLAINLRNDDANMLGANHATTVTTAQVTTSGDLLITGTAGRGLRTLTNVTTAAGDITVSADAGDVTIATATASSGGGGGNVSITAVDGTVRVGSVTAAGDDIAITASAQILESGADSAADLVSRTLTLLADTGIGTSAAAIEIDAVTLTSASVTVSGPIALEDTVGGLIASSVTTASGDISLRVLNGDLTATLVRAGTATAGDGNISLATVTSGNVWLDSVSAEGDAVSITSATGDAINEVGGGDPDKDITANSLTLLGAAGIGTSGVIEIDANALTATTTATSGNASINLSDQIGSLAVTSATTANGDVTLHALGGGNLTVTIATAGGPVRNILLTTENGGSVVIGNATEADGTITIESSGAIEESGIDTAADLTASQMHLTAVTGIGNLGKIEINAVTLDADTASGAINLSDLAGGLHVTSATTSLATGSGNITLNTNSGNLVVDLATAGKTGGGAAAADGNITLTTTTSGSVSVGTITAELDSVSITTASLGTITEQAPSNGTAAVVAAQVVLHGAAGVGTAGPAGKFEIDATNSLTATTTNTGDRPINVLDVAGGLNITTATTVSGGITIEAVNGTLNATTVTAGGTAKSVVLTTTTSGDVRVGNVTAASDAITIWSAGAIEELTPTDTAADLTATSLTLTAASGIGAAGRIEVSVVTGVQVVTTTGDIGLEDTSGGLAITLAQTGNGNIDLRATTTLSVTTVTAGTNAAGDGNIELRSSSTSGVTVLGHVTASGDTVTVVAGTGGSLTANGGGALVTANWGQFTAKGGMNVNTSLNELTAETKAGDLIIHETDDLLLNSASTDTGDVTITLNAANATLTGSGVGTHLVSTGSSAVATLTAGGGILGLRTSTAQLAANTSASNGAVEIVETNGLQINLLNAGTGDVSLQLVLAGNLTQTGDVTADEFRVIADAGNVTLTRTTNNVATLAGQTKGGNFSYTDVDALTIGTVGATSGIDTGDMAVGGNVTINAGGLLTVAAAIDSSTGTGGILTLGSGVSIASTIKVGAGDVVLNGGGAALDTIIAADVTVAGDISLNVERDILIQNKLATINGGKISLIADRDGDGVGGVRVETAGQIDSAATVLLQGSNLFVEPAVADDAVRIDADGTNAQVQAAGAINVQANAIAAATAKSYVAGVVENSSGGITFHNPVRLTGDTLVTAGSGVIAFQKTIDQDTSVAADLTLSAGTGSVSLLGNIGSATPIDRLIISRADGGVTIGTDASPVTLVNTVGEIDIGVSTRSIGGTGIVLNGGGDNNNAGASDSRIFITTNGARIRFNGPVLLNSDATISTGATSDGDIVFTNDAPLNSSGTETNDLLLTAGTGAVRFNEDIGGTRNLNTFTITRADGGVFFGEFDSETGPGEMGPVTLVNTAGSINLGIPDEIGTTNEVGIVLNGGSGTILFQTSGDDVRFNGAVKLQSQAHIDTSTGTGSITFTSAATIDSQDGSVALPLATTVEKNNLLLDAGSGRIVFNANLGAAQPLGDFTVDRASLGVVFGGADAGVVGGAGPVTLVVTGGAIDIGSGTDVIGTAAGGVGIILNGGATGLLTIQTSDENVRFNGPLRLQTDVRIDTDAGPAEIPSRNDLFPANGNITFTAAATIDSQNGTFTNGTSVGDERHDLRLDAGDRLVSFNGNIGATQRLDSLIVERAQAGVVIGGSDGVATTSGGGARVQTVSTDGEIILGRGTDATGVIDLAIGTSADAEIRGVGIVLNGGAGLLTIQTSDADLQFNGAVHLQSNVRLDTDEGVAGSPSASSGGDILFTSFATINSQNGTLAVPSAANTERNDLTIDVGDRELFFNANIGSTQRIGLFTVERAGAGIIFGAADSSTTGGAGAVTAVLTDDHIDLGQGTNADNVIGGDGIVLNGGDSGRVLLQTTNDNLRFNGAVWLQTAVSLDHNEVGFDPVPGIGTDNITFTSAATINSQDGTRLTPSLLSVERNALSIENGDATLFFNADIGAKQRLGEFVVTRSLNGVIFGAADTVTTGGAGPVKRIFTDGEINIGSGNNSQNVIRLDGIVFNGGASPIEISTINDNVRLNGAVTLKSNTRIDTGSGAGDITFTNDAPIDSQLAENNDLVLRAGTGVVRFNENIGEAQRIGALTVESASQIIFGEADIETPLTGGQGPVNIVNTNAVIDLGSVNVISDGIVLNGGTLAVGDSLVITTTSDAVRLNGAVWLATNVRIDTDDQDADTHAGGAQILFTNDAPLNSLANAGVTEGNSLTLAAGTAQVLFNEDIGAAANGSLGRLVVEEADAGVVFGQADTESVAVLPLDDQGPVNTVSLVGDGTAAFALDLGSLETLGTIVLNGGPDEIVITTTGDDIRVNGPVTLQSPTRIDTGSGAGNVTFTSSSPIDSQASEEQSLTISADLGSVRFGALVGSTEPLGQILITAATTAIDGGGVVTTGSQTYLGDMSLGANATLQHTGAASLLVTGSIDTQSSFLTDNAVTAATTSRLIGPLFGNGGLVKTGDGLLQLDGDSTNLGTTTVEQGTLLVLGESGFGETHIEDAAMLAGTGKVNGNLVVEAGGTVSVGDAAGLTGFMTLRGDVTFETGSTFLLDMNGPYVFAGTNFDQLVVGGSTTIQLGVILQLRGGEAPQTARNEAVIIRTVGGTLNGQFQPGIGSVDASSNASVQNYRGLLVDENFNVILRSNSVVPTRPPPSVIPQLPTPVVVRYEPSVRQSAGVLNVVSQVDERVIVEALEIGVRRIEIRIVTPTDDQGNTIEETKLQLDPEWLKNLPAVLRQLPDNRYRVYLILEDGEERQVMDAVVRDQKPFDREEARPAIRLQPPPPPNNEEIDDESNDETTEDAADQMPAAAVSRTERNDDSPPPTATEELPASDDAGSRSTAAIVLTGAVAMTGATATSSWKTLVEQAVTGHEGRTLSKARRVWRRLNRSSKP